MRKFKHYYTSFLTNFSEKNIVEKVRNNKKKVFLIISFALLMLILYELSFLPYLNLFISQILLLNCFLFGSILIINPRPQTVIKLVVFLFIFLIFPIILDFQTLPEQIGNFIYILLIIAAVLYIGELRKENSK